MLPLSLRANVHHRPEPLFPLQQNGTNDYAPPHELGGRKKRFIQAQRISSRNGGNDDGKEDEDEGTNQGGRKRPAESYPLEYSEPRLPVRSCRQAGQTGVGGPNGGGQTERWGRWQHQPQSKLLDFERSPAGLREPPRNMSSSHPS